jgi:hypothetical protein
MNAHRRFNPLTTTPAQPQGGVSRLTGELAGYTINGLDCVVLRLCRRWELIEVGTREQSEPMAASGHNKKCAVFSIVNSVAITNRLTVVALVLNTSLINPVGSVVCAVSIAVYMCALISMVPV